MRGAMIAAAVVVWSMGVGPAAAGPLDPFDFASLGVFDVSSGGYTIESGPGGATLTGPGVSLTGVYYQGLAVFDFTSFHLGAGASLSVSRVVTGPGSMPSPIVLLSRGDATIAGAIDVSGPSGLVSVSNWRGAGAQPTNAGVGATQNVYDDTHTLLAIIAGGAGGGGFGGAGGDGEAFRSPLPTGLVIAPGGAGGPERGNLADRLEGGSAGAGSSYSGYTGGGGGGGAIEIGAVGTITVAATGSIHADGGAGGSQTGSGGGSGGGVFLHGAAVSILGPITATGGAGGTGAQRYREFVADGGRGGGGRVLITTSAMDATGDFRLINVAGSHAGLVQIRTVPEPSAWVLMTLGLTGMAALARPRGAAAR